MDPPASRLATVLEMLPPAAAGPGVCPVCRTFTAPRAVDPCPVCRHQPCALSAIAPISYSVSGGRLHRELRAYKDDASESIRGFASLTVAALLDRFLSGHEACVAVAAGVRAFALVTTVPSRTRRADACRVRLRAIVRACPAVGGRFRRLLVAGAAPGARHHWSAARYDAVSHLAGADVLLIDDTWTTGASAQAAALALRRGGAASVALVVIGRQVSPDHADNVRRLAALGAFDWRSCAVHADARRRRAAEHQPGGALVPPEAPRESATG